MRALLVAALAWAAVASAAEAPERAVVEPDLPPPERVEAAMRDYPAVAAARAGVRAQEAASAALRAGSYEYAVRVEGGERRDTSIDTRFNEWNALLERPIRLPAKADLDRRIGSEIVDQAKLTVGDALHEAGRTLLRLWFGWMRAAATEQVWRSQVDILSAERDVVSRRVRLGDAPRQESLLADAAVAQADTSRLQARARAEAALAELLQSFPGIAPPAAPVLVTPRPVEQDAAYWRDAYLTHNHELAVARAEVRRRSLIASRAQADTVPDPTLGVRYASERGNTDRIFGVFVAVPLPGEARSARATESAAQIDAASSREAALVRRLSAEAASLYATARAGYESAERAVGAATGMRRNAELSSRAYSLGEANLADVLLARRLAIETELSATLARLEAAESRYRLLLDAHELWPLD
jgi:outer membrane protein TolC